MSSVVFTILRWSISTKSSILYFTSTIRLSVNNNIQREHVLYLMPSLSTLMNKRLINTDKILGWNSSARADCNENQKHQSATKDTFHHVRWTFTWLLSKLNWAPKIIKLLPWHARANNGSRGRRVELLREEWIVNSNSVIRFTIPKNIKLNL